MKPSLLIVGLAVLAVVGCKKEQAAPAVSPQAMAMEQERLKIDQERLKTEKAALYQQQKEAIDRELKEAIAKADASLKETTDMYVRMIADGTVSKATAQKTIDTATAACDRAHQWANEDAMRKLNALQKP